MVQRKAALMAVKGSVHWKESRTRWRGAPRGAGKVTPNGPT